MEQNKKYTLESYLVTWQDYAAFQVALRRMKTRRMEVMGFRLLGMALIFLSLLARVYFIYRNSYNSTVLFLLLCLGVGICLYYDYGMPYLVRRKACKYFNRKFKKMVANAAEIDDSGIRFISEMGNTRMDYQQLQRAYEDKRVILLEENDEIRFLPKRVLTMDEYQGVRQFLKRALREKYVQEGVC